MSQLITVKDLTGDHLGKVITISTEHTTATGVLQSIQHISEVYRDRSYSGTSYARAGVETKITLLPDQEIKAKMADEVEVNGNHWPAMPERNAAHQEEMNGEVDYCDGSAGLKDGRE